MKFVVPQKKTLTVEFQGKEYALAKPSLPKAEAFEDAFAEASKAGKGMIGVMKGYVVDCGMPLESANELDLEQLMALAEALTPKKN